MGNKEMQKKQVELQPSELTYFQQVAVAGEVALMYTNKSHIEKAYSTFIKLALVDEKYLAVYKNEMLKYVDESFINDCIRYRYTEIVPTYLYAAKYIYDLNVMLGNDDGAMRIFNQPKEAVVSRFITYFREMLTYLPVTGVAILDTMLNEGGDSLDFLAPTVFALKQCKVNDIIEERGKIGYDVKLKLLSMPIDQAPIMYIQAEDDRLAQANTMETLTNETNIRMHVNNLLSKMKQSKEEVEDVEDGEEPQPTEEKLVHVVKKIDKATGAVVSVKEFGSHKEAYEYVQDMVKGYPEIVKRFYFQVELVEM